MRTILGVLLLSTLALHAPCAFQNSTAGAREMPAPAAHSPEVINLMPEFFLFWEQTAGGNAVRRVERFRKTFIESHRPFYGSLVSVPDDDGLAQYLDTLAPAIEELRQLSTEFPPQLDRAWHELVKRYPDFDPEIPTYLAPSLFTSNGQVRYLEGRYVVMFGLDVSAYLRHNPGWLPVIDDPLLTARHELFHAYHYQVNTEVAAAARKSFTPERAAPLYFDLWSEGLASFATHQLDPDLPLGAVLYSDQLAREGPPALSRLARELRLRLDSSDADEVRDYFFMSSQREDIPKRAGYYVGYEVAAHLAKGHTLEQLIRLEGADLRAAIESALRVLEQRKPGE